MRNFKLNERVMVKIGKLDTYYNQFENNLYDGVVTKLYDDGARVSVDNKYFSQNGIGASIITPIFEPWEVVEQRKVRPLDKLACSEKMPLAPDELVEAWINERSVTWSYLKYIFNITWYQEDLISYILMEELPLTAPDDVEELRIDTFREISKMNHKECEKQMEDLLK